jgi:hypothetical protein
LEGRPAYARGQAEETGNPVLAGALLGLAAGGLLHILFGKLN